MALRNYEVDLLLGLELCALFIALLNGYVNFGFLVALLLLGLFLGIGCEVDDLDVCFVTHIIYYRI